MKRVIIYALVLAALTSCKKSDTSDECVPYPVQYDEDFVVFPKTGIWVHYTVSSPSQQKWLDTIRIGDPRLFTLPTKNFGYDTVGIEIPVTRYYYPVIKTRNRIDSNGVVTYSAIDTMAFIREDTLKKRLFRVEAISPIDDAHFECLLFDYSLAPGGTMDLTYGYAYDDNSYVTAYDSIQFNNRYLRRVYVTDEYHRFYSNPRINPNIMGFHIGALDSYALDNNALVWRKLIYNGQELKITYKIE